MYKPSLVVLSIVSAFSVHAQTQTVTRQVSPPQTQQQYVQNYRPPTIVEPKVDTTVQQKAMAGYRALLSDGAASSLPPVADHEVRAWLDNNPGVSDARIRQEMDKYGVGVQQMARVTGLSQSEVQMRYNQAYAITQPSSPLVQVQQPSVVTYAPPAVVPQRVTPEEIQQWFRDNPNYTLAQMRQAMDTHNVTVGEVADAMGMTFNDVQRMYDRGNPNQPQKTCKFIWQREDGGATVSITDTPLHPIRAQIPEPPKPNGVGARVSEGAYSQHSAEGNRFYNYEPVRWVSVQFCHY